MIPTQERLLFLALHIATTPFCKLLAKLPKP